METRVEILPTAAASIPEATARLLMSKLGSNAPSALHRLLWQTQKLGRSFKPRSLILILTTDRWGLPRCSILYKKTEDSISDPPPLPDTPLSLTHDTQTCFKNTEPHQSGGVKEKKGEGASYSTDNIIPHSLRSPIARLRPTHFTDAEHETTTGATNIRDSSKRKADSAGLDEDGEGMHRLEKVRYTGQCAAPSPCERV